MNHTMDYITQKTRTLALAKVLYFIYRGETYKQYNNYNVVSEYMLKQALKYRINT